MPDRPSVILFSLRTNSSEFKSKPVRTRVAIFFWEIYQNGRMYTKWPLNYQMALNIPNGRNTNIRKAIKYTNIFHLIVLQNSDFWLENIPSGNVFSGLFWNFIGKGLCSSLWKQFIPLKYFNKKIMKNTL
jgi:hypothetical protein